MENVDLRDLTRAAASVAAMEELLVHPSLTLHNDGEEEDGDGRRIDVVENLRPEAEAVVTSVRRAAAGLMDELQNHGNNQNNNNSNTSICSPGGAPRRVLAGGIVSPRCRGASGIGAVPSCGAREDEGCGCHRGEGAGGGGGIVGVVEGKGPEPEQGQEVFGFGRRCR